MRSLPVRMVNCEVLPVRLAPNGKMLVRKHPNDAGLDIATPFKFDIYPESSVFIDTGVAVKIPEGHFGLMTQRSSVGANLNCVLSLGIIDSGYIGHLKFKMFNLGPDRIFFEEGDRVAQLVIVPFIAPEPVEVLSLLDTERGEHGIGSTGK